MLKRIGLFASGLALSASASFGNAAQDFDMETVESELTELATSAQTLFNTVAPIVIGVVALGVLIAFIKKVKKS